MIFIWIHVLKRYRKWRDGLEESTTTTTTTGVLIALFAGGVGVLYALYHRYSGPKQPQEEIQGGASSLQEKESERTKSSSNVQEDEEIQGATADQQNENEGVKKSREDLDRDETRQDNVEPQRQEPEPQIF